MVTTNADKYNRVDSKIMVTSFVLSDQMVVSTTKIIVDRLFDWSVLLVESDKRICNTSEGFTIPFN